MKRALLVALLVATMTMPALAFDINGYKVDANDKVVITLLAMVANDLQMCQASLRSDYIDNVLAIGHINNAQSALKRTTIDPAYTPLINEILDRLGKIKFYLVMRDLDNVNMRLVQLISVIQSVTGGNIPNLPNPGGYNGGTYYPNNGSFNGGYNNGGYQGGSIPMPGPSERPIGSQGPAPVNGGGLGAGVGIPLR